MQEEHGLLPMQCREKQDSGYGFDVITVFFYSYVNPASASVNCVLLTEGQWKSTKDSYHQFILDKNHLMLQLTSQKSKSSFFRLVTTSA